MDVYTLFLAVKGLPEKTWLYHIDKIVMITVGAGILLYILMTLFLSYRRNRFCPCCHSGTRLGCRTEKIDARRKWVRVGSKWHYGGFVIQKVVTVRCPQCGWEIDLGK